LDQESRAPVSEEKRLSSGADPGGWARDPEPPVRRDLDWMLHGKHGLRAGWSIAIFIVLYRLFLVILGTIAVGLYPELTRNEFAPGSALVGELIPLLALLGAAGFVVMLEHRSLLDYNLRGPRRGQNLLAGAGAGFAALSVLVLELACGGWLHFGPVALGSTAALRYGALWGCAFLLVGCVEEGTFRCFLQYTFARGLNFWWALAIEIAVCIDLWLRSHGQAGISTLVWPEPLPPVSGSGMWGVVAVALLGAAPCFLLHARKARDAGFWQAAWVTSTLFGFVHTGNNGENWIGIFAAASIGFVFCVSVWVTGSAWWAIGCHAAWDWAETFFYGTADSGFAAKGHFLTTSPAGNPLWSGGADGPEGSLLVLGVILLLLVSLMAVHSRARKPRAH
jgi:membrane protease YdiL (CAAX protease family)